MSPTQQLALWADELRDMSAMGLIFSQNIYDRENYQRIQNIAMQMLALVSDESLDEVEPLRHPHFARPTPLSTGDAAIIDATGNILLIRRADNQKWAMPGGAMSVGETPAEAVAREAFEETGVRVEPVAFVGVHDSRRCGTIARFHLYHFLFLCKPLNPSTHALHPAGQAGSGPVAFEHEPSHALEVLDRQWFAEDALPDAIDPGHVLRIAAAYRTWHGECAAYFDR